LAKEAGRENQYSIAQKLVTLDKAMEILARGEKEEPPRCVSCGRPMVARGFSSGVLKKYEGKGMQLWVCDCPQQRGTS
jgi:hypothetical protein